ncbi:MAG: PIG-L deacetylase family protein [Phototrophicaceae bacterium]
MIVFLSPHFDDAVYSCGGLLHQLTRQGQSVQVITLMGGMPTHPAPDTPIVRQLHQRWGGYAEPVAVRIQEDQQAVRLLGAQPLHLPITDCIYRTDGQGNALYPDDSSLWELPHRDDPALDYLRSWSLPSTVEKLYIPLGIGQHVDHIIVHEWALWYTNEHQWDASRIFFYADYPYAGQQTAVEARLQMVRTYCPPLHMQAIPLSDEDLQAKIQAMQAYRSQVTSFWQDEWELDQSMRAYHQRQRTHDGAFTEPYYQCF